MIFKTYQGWWVQGQPRLSFSFAPETICQCKHNKVHTTQSNIQFLVPCFASLLPVSIALSQLSPTNVRSWQVQCVYDYLVISGRIKESSHLHSCGLNILFYAVHNLSLFMHHCCKILTTETWSVPRKPQKPPFTLKMVLTSTMSDSSWRILCSLCSSCPILSSSSIISWVLHKNTLEFSIGVGEEKDLDCPCCCCSSPGPAKAQLSFCFAATRPWNVVLKVLRGKETMHIAIGHGAIFTCLSRSAASLWTLWKLFRACKSCSWYSQKHQ